MRSGFITSFRRPGPARDRPRCRSWGGDPLHPAGLGRSWGPDTPLRSLASDRGPLAVTRRGYETASRLRTAPSALALTLLLLVNDPDVSAQTSQIDAYVFAGPGQFAGDSLNFGAVGAEFIGQRGVGLGIEVGRSWGIGPHVDERHSDANTAFDLHVVATVAPKEHQRVAPFFIAGLSRFSNPQRDSYIGAVFGLGADIWMTGHVALRIDGRLPFLATHGASGGGTVGMGFTLR